MSTWNIQVTYSYSTPSAQRVKTADLAVEADDHHLALVQAGVSIGQGRISPVTVTGVTVRKVPS